MIMVPSLTNIKCQRRDKPAGARTVQRELCGSERTDPDLTKKVGLPFWGGGRKNILINYIRL